MIPDLHGAIHAEQWFNMVVAGMFFLSCILATSNLSVGNCRNKSDTHKNLIILSSLEYSQTLYIST